MKRVFCLLLALVLLTGCIQVPVDDDGTGMAMLPTPPTAAPQTLRVGGDLPLQTGSAAMAAIQAYSEAMGVEISSNAGDPTAGLALLRSAPVNSEGYYDLSNDPLLAAAAARAGLGFGSFYALPLGRSLYAYWANGNVLTALLGEDCLTDVQNASWEEWSAFAAALTAWLEDPSATAVTLSGRTYTLPAERPTATRNLRGVFGQPPVTDGEWGSGAAFTAPLLAAGNTWTSATLSGPLNGLNSAFALELDNAVPESDRAESLSAQLQVGSALFVRASLADLAAAGPVEGLVPVPFKGEYSETDLTTEQYNLTGLMNYPVLAGAGYLAIPASADEQARQAGISAILWLYSSALGESTLIDDLLLITPWSTASDTTTPGAMQIRQAEVGVLPEVELTAEEATALGEAWLALADGGDRAAWRQAAIAVLAQP